MLGFLFKTRLIAMSIVSGNILVKRLATSRQETYLSD